MAAMSKYLAKQHLDWVLNREMQTDGTIYEKWEQVFSEPEPVVALPEITGAAAVALGAAAVVAKNPVVSRRWWRR